MDDLTRLLEDGFLVAIISVASESDEEVLRKDLLNEGLA